MTALTMPARPDEDDASLRPVPWRRMAGVIWRQHRIALAGVAVLLGALAVWLWIIGIPLHHAYAAATACQPASSPACQNLIGTFDVSATNSHGRVWCGAGAVHAAATASRSASAGTSPSPNAGPSASPTFRQACRVPSLKTNPAAFIRSARSPAPSC